jgi:hypothetical protein
LSRRPPKKALAERDSAATAGYDSVLTEVVRLLEDSRRASARAVNTIMTATYWEVGRRIVEGEQSGGKRAGYGKELLKRLSADLTAKFRRGFSQRNLEQMRLFYPGWQIPQTVSAKSHPAEALPSGDQNSHDPSSELSRPAPPRRFPLPWSHYVRLMTVKSEQARSFYEAEALRGGWSVRQAGPANRLPVLRADGAVPQQGRDAAEGE